MAGTPTAAAVLTINMTVEPLSSPYGDKNYVAITTTTEVSCVLTSGPAPTGSSAFDVLSGPAKAVTLALARPWLWRRASSGDDKARIAFRATGQLDPPSLSDAMTRPADDFFDWLRAPLDDLATGARRFNTPVAWHHALENALRQPGQLGRILGLAHFVTADQGGTFSPDDAAGFASLVGAPDFDVNVPGRDFVVRARASPVLDWDRYFDLARKNWVESDDDLKKRKEYDYFGYNLDSDTHDLSEIYLVARIHRYQARTPTQDPHHPYIDSDMWIKFPSGNYDFWSGRDWFSRLPMDVADAADLPKHFATGLMNWVRTNKSQPHDPTIEQGQDKTALDLFFRLVLGTYGFGAVWTYERSDEKDPNALNAPTASTLHTVLQALSLQEWNFANTPTATDDQVQTDLHNVWLDLVKYDASSNNTALAARMLAAALLRNAQDQATKDLVVQLSSASISDRLSGASINIEWYNRWLNNGGRDFLQKERNKYVNPGNHDSDFVDWVSFKFDWESFSTFLQAVASAFRDANAGGFVFNRWLAMTQDDAVANSLAVRQTEALAALAKIRLPQRLVLDEMQDFWVKLVDDKTQLAPDGGEPPSVLRVRSKLRDRVAERFHQAISDASAGALLGDLNDPKTLGGSVQFEINAAIQRVGGDPDKKDTGNTDPRARELGSDVVVDVPQPLTFQVGAITGGDKDDRLELKQRFAGFGVLVRNASDNVNGDWHCLTLGQLVPRSGGPPFGNVADTASPRYQAGADLVALGHNPWRIITQAGLDGWVVPFHGAPLTARPKLLDAFDATDATGLTPDHPSNVQDRPYDVVQITSPSVWADQDHVEFKALKSPWERWDKLLALAYGRKYEFAFFAQTQSGALPPGLTAGSSPTEFKLPDGAALPPVTGNDNRIVSLRYLRRTAIGAPRLLKDAQPGADPEPAVFPLPSREEPWPVFPLVEDLVGRGVLIDPTKYPDPTNPNALDTFNNRVRPVSDEIGRLAVLTPLSIDKTNSAWELDRSLWDRSAQVVPAVRFAIAPPSVPVNDWVLWRTRDLDIGKEPQQAIRNDIRDILAAFHKKELQSRDAPTAQNPQSKDALTKEDGRAPDDPAVEHLVIRVTKVFEEGKCERRLLGTWSIALAGRKKKADVATLKPKPEDLWRWQTRPFPIQITALEYTTDTTADDLKLPFHLDNAKPKTGNNNVGGNGDTTHDKVALQTVDLQAHNVAQGPVATTVEGLEFFVNKGTVYRFEFFAGVPEVLFVPKAGENLEQARIRSMTPAFALGPDRDSNAIVRAEEPDSYTTDKGPIRLLSMTVLTVEVADGDLTETVGRDAVWNATDQLATSGSQLTIGVKNWDASNPWPFWQAKRAMLNRQLWGWTGRTYRSPVVDYASNIFTILDKQTAKHSKDRLISHVQPCETFGRDARTSAARPHDLFGDRDDEAWRMFVEDWRTFVEQDGAWFGDRADLDSTVSVGLLTPPPKDVSAAGTAVPGEALQSGPVYRISLDHDRRAQYWRFSARLESRYIGLLAPAARDDRGRVRGGWRRLLIKARPTNKLPKPKLKFVLPLTEPFDFGDGKPKVPVSSLLVILEEQWGETAGFAERLVARITPWTDDAGPYEDPRPPPPDRSEVGIDPIVSASAPMPDSKDGSLMVDASPFGLTYDLDVDRPRPAATAFQVRLDDDWLAKWMDQRAPHVFAQDVMAMVQFRRIADSALTTVQAEVDGTNSYVSDWTKAEWVIFNADARYWRVQTPQKGYDFVHVKDLRMKPDGSVAQQDANGVRSAPVCANDPDEASMMMRLLFAVVTEDIFLADGSKTEDFLAVGEIKPGMSMPIYAGYKPMPVAPPKPAPAKAGEPPPPPPPPQRGRKLRLLEVEMHRRARKLYQDGDSQRGFDQWDRHDKAFDEDNDGYLAVANAPRSDADFSLLKDAPGHWLWRFLFPSPDQNNAFTRDAIMRIRRVSPPIGMLEPDEPAS